MGSVQLVAIQNYGSSGSTLLHSLMDNHPNVMQMPGLHARGLYGFWIKHNRLNFDTFLKIFFKTYEAWFSAQLVDAEFGFQSMGENQDEILIVDKKRFEQYFKKHFRRQNFNSRDFIIQCHRAYDYSLGKQNKNKTVLVYPLHTIGPEECAQMFNDFPDLKIMNMVRHPISLYYSSLKHCHSMHARSKTLSYNYTEATLSFLLNDYIYAQDRQYETFAFRYFPQLQKKQQVAIPLEILHQNPVASTKFLTDWLNIPWHNTLLESTFNGKKWWNRAESVKINGFTKKPAELTKNKTGWKIDEFRIQALTRNQMFEWGYSEIQPINYRLLITILIPFKSEYTSIKFRFHQVPRMIIRTVSKNKTVQQNKETIKSNLRLKRKKTAKFNGIIFLLYSISALLIPVLIIRDYLQIRLILWKAFMRTKFDEKDEIVKKLTL